MSEQQVKFLTLTKSFFPFSMLLFFCLDVEGFTRALEWISRLILLNLKGAQSDSG